jgi:FkbM family methyltransferase
MSILLRFGKPRTFVQVGAYTGDDALIADCRRYGHRLYMFEPNPRRAAELEQKAAGDSSIHVISKAVSNYEGRATFHIACYDDCSSLQTFDTAANEKWVHPWHPYKKFEMVDDVDVEVVRLDSFMRQENISVIDRLEIDAQGEDLRVVESLGERIRDVKKIQIEVNIHDSPLYRNSFTRQEAVGFFAAHGFEPHISWKQSMGREENMIFRNRWFYPNAPANELISAIEQGWKSAAIAWVKLPRVLAVTKMMMMRKLAGKA